MKIDFWNDDTLSYLILHLRWTSVGRIDHTIEQQVPLLVRVCTKLRHLSYLLGPVHLIFYKVEKHPCSRIGKGKSRFADASYLSGTSNATKTTQRNILRVIIDLYCMLRFSRAFAATQGATLPPREFCSRNTIPLERSHRHQVDIILYVLLSSCVLAQFSVSQSTAPL